MNVYDGTFSSISKILLKTFFSYCHIIVYNIILYLSKALSHERGVLAIAIHNERIFTLGIREKI